MPYNLQFLDDPDDVPYINQSTTLHVGVNGDDVQNNGSSESPFRTLGKAIDVLRGKQIKKDAIVTVQLGAIATDRFGKRKKYFEEEQINIDFESAKRIKIKGIKPTDHEILGISYYDAVPGGEGFYCQVIVTNQDKIAIGDYLSVYDHFKIKKKDPSHFWATTGVPKASSRFVTPSNCYVESIRGDMIVGVHEVVDVSNTVDQNPTVPTELFEAEGLKVGAVTLHIKNHNYTFNRTKEIPFYSTLGRMYDKPLFTYAAGAGNSPLESQQNNLIPPILYGADMLSNPQTAESNGFEQFYYASSVQQVEIVDIMVRGYGFSLSALDNKIVDPRTGKIAKNASLLWNDKTLNGFNRVVVANPIASYFYNKLINDLAIKTDLPFYFGLSTNPFVTMESVIKASKKIRDYLLNGARQIDGIPPWEEDNHPGYGFGPFESGVQIDPLSSPQVDTSSYPQEYADNSKFSILLRYYNIYPPINGQLYQPTLVKRIQSWYNDNGTKNGIQLDKWELKGNKSPFFCGYITPQGWYKKQFSSNPDATAFTTSVPSFSDLSDLYGYHRLSGVSYPAYIGNPLTSFSIVGNGAIGTISNDRTSTKNLPLIDQTRVDEELSGACGGSAKKGSMGTVWYAGTVNGDISLGSPTLSAYGTTIFDRYSLGYISGNLPSPNDEIVDKETTIVNDNNTSRITTTQSMNLRGKCFKTVLRFSANGICVKSKTKLPLLKDVCLVKVGKKQGRHYGLLADGESVVNATNIAVCSFSCGISARNQSLVNLLTDLSDSSDASNRGILKAVDPGAVVSANDIGIESAQKSHVNAQRTVSSGSKTANYLSIVNSSMDCSNALSVGSHKHGFVSEYNSYMKAINCFSEFNGGIGFCTANNSILVCHRSRSLWNGSHGVFANSRGTIRCYEFISRSNNGDGFLAQRKSIISAGANSSSWTNYRREMEEFLAEIYGNITTGYDVRASIPPHLFQISVVKPADDPTNPFVRLPEPIDSINRNPTFGIAVFYHECNSTIAEFNAGSGFASETDSLIVADNTISRYNSKMFGEFFIYGWSGTRGSFPTDTYASGGV